MNIKGHTEIQLTDVNSKKTKVFHDDNMLTNGIRDYIKNHGLLHNNAFPANVRGDFIKSLLGGVMLFDTRLTEDADEYYIPAGVLMVANGCMNVLNGSETGDPTELGSYNASESGWQDDNHTVFRMVYDWNTAQGNGTIRCACLTSALRGYIGEGNGTSKLSKGNNTYYNMIAFGDMIERQAPLFDDGSNRQLVMLMILGNWSYWVITEYNHNDHVYVYKLHMSNTEFDIRDVFGSSTSQFVTNNLIEVLDLELTDIEGVTSYFDEASAVGYADSTNIYIICTGGTGKLTEIKLLLDGTFVSAETITSHDLGIGDNRNLSIMDIYDGYFYIKAMKPDNTSDLYKVQLTNIANVELIDDDRSSWVDVDSYLTEHNGRLLLTNGDIYDPVLNRRLITNTLQSITGRKVFNDQKALITYKDTGRYGSRYMVARDANYLASINNLSQDITKDATQTMKLIYTLTFTN